MLKQVAEAVIPTRAKYSRTTPLSCKARARVLLVDPGITRR